MAFTKQPTIYPIIFCTRSPHSPFDKSENCICRVPAVAIRPTRMSEKNFCISSYITYIQSRHTLTHPTSKQPTTIEWKRTEEQGNNTLFDDSPRQFSRFEPQSRNDELRYFITANKSLALVCWFTWPIVLWCYKLALNLILFLVDIISTTRN